MLFIFLSLTEVINDDYRLRPDNTNAVSVSYVVKQHYIIIIIIIIIMKNFNRHDSHGHHSSKRRELAQHALTWITPIQWFTHALTSTQLQPCDAKRQLSY